MLKTMLLLLVVLADKPKTEDYDKTLAGMKDRTNKLTKVDFYDKLEFKNKTTGEVRHLKDFDEFNQQVFFILVAEKLSEELGSKHKEWAGAVEKLDEDDEGKEKLDKAIFELTSLRKKHAKNWEKLVDSVFSKYKDKFIDEETKLYKKQMQDYNDKNKLIERK